ncbi:hypothetical protein J1614_006937 [Plenodomus biglobosus]|nr:hypothetical protein J1614_006937 [Plenodomus biglobosus]
MKPSTAASCTVANEILRRHTQLDQNPTARLCRGSDQRAFITRTASDDVSLHQPDYSQISHEKVKQLCKRRALNIEENNSTEAGRSKGVAHSTSTAIEQRQTPNMWRIGLDLDRKNSSVFAVIRRGYERPTRNTKNAQLPSSQDSNDWGGNESSDTQGGAQEWTARTDDECGQEITPESRNRSSAIEDNLRDHEESVVSCFSSTVDVGVRQVPTRSKSTSPTSDTTLYESTSNSPCTPFKTDTRPWDRAPHAESKHGRAASPQENLPDKDGNQTPTPVRRDWALHQRELLTDSFIPARTPMPLRARARTNDGLLQLKANTAHDSNIPIGVKGTHRRKISLKIPINTPTRRAETVQHFNQSNWNESPRRSIVANSRALVTTNNPARPLTHEERELEYKHRHTFIGTTSLDDFLEALEVSSTHTTTKEAVARVFISLASNEQIHARQSSTKTEGWELVPRVTPDISSIDYVAQLQVKLGSITLRQFLDMIPFDKKEDVGALCVVEAFSAASHLDAQAGVGTGRKARAFRTWMVTQAHDMV